MGSRPLGAMGKRQRDDDDWQPSTSGVAPNIGMQTSGIKNKIVRSEKYAKLRHEKNKVAKKERAKKEKELERAEALGIEPPPKPVPKASQQCHCCCFRTGRGGLIVGCNTACICWVAGDASRLPPAATPLLSLTAARAAYLDCWLACRL